MEFRSIEEINKHFGLDIEDINELRRELKKHLQSVHSDKTGGEYKSMMQKREHEETSAAIDFIDNSTSEITLTRKDWTSLQRQVKEITKVKSKIDFAKIQEIGLQLDASIQASISRFRRHHLPVKIALGTLAVVVSVLWAFPFLAENYQPISGLMGSFKSALSVIWVITMLICILLGIYIRKIERIDYSIKEHYSLDSTQNQIFRFFLAWFRIAYAKSTEHDSATNKHTYKFTRDDLYNFTLNYYLKLSGEFHEIVSYTTFDLYYEISRSYKNSKEILKRQKNAGPGNNKFMMLFFKSPGEIDIDLAHKLSDAMVSKLIERDLIRKHDKQIFNDTYIYTE